MGLKTNEGGLAMTQLTYIRPSLIHISHHQAARLYGLEAERDDLIKKCAEEWAAVQKVSAHELWTRSMPQQLFDILEAFDRRAAYEAAKAYVERYEAKERGAVR
jgi:hypothetical protein